MVVFFQNTLLFGISGGEIFLVLLVVLIFFGPSKIPEIAKYLGKGINEIKKAQRELKDEINNYSDTMENEAREMQQSIDEIKKEVNKKENP